MKYIRTNQRGNVEGASFATNPAYFSALQTPAGIPFNEIRDYNSPFHDLKDIMVHIPLIRIIFWIIIII